MVQQSDVLKWFPYSNQILHLPIFTLTNQILHLKLIAIVLESEKTEDSKNYSFPKNKASIVSEISLKVVVFDFSFRMETTTIHFLMPNST